jgi:hypothetical protein
MRRIILLGTVALVMAAILVASAMPALAFATVPVTSPTSTSVVTNGIIFQRLGSDSGIIFQREGQHPPSPCIGDFCTIGPGD